MQVPDPEPLALPPPGGELPPETPIPGRSGAGSSHLPLRPSSAHG
jgi:hypothetical protein